MMKQVLRSIVLLFVLFLPTTLFADQRFIVDYFKNFQTLEANFTQEIITKDREDTTSGTLIIDKGSVEGISTDSAKGSVKQGAKGVQNPKFLFDYTKPYHQTLVSNGVKFWFYDVDLMQVIIKPVDEVINNPVLQILLSNQLLSDNFDIKTVRDRREYLLTPKIANSDMEITDIQVIFANRKIYSFKVQDVTGQTVSFVVKRVVENSEVDSSLFDFKIPADVDVIDETK